MRKILLLMIISSFAGSSCKKDEKESLSNTELLTRKMWVHEHEMVDLNNNLKPDDEKGIQKDLTFKFNSDGTLEYSKDDIVKQLHWKFENNETVIGIIGIMDDSIIPPVEESSHSIYLLDQNTFILFYASTIAHPDIRTFEIFKN